MTRKQTSSGDVAAVLIGDIRRGAIEVGAPLPTERALCERFTSTRPTVREAIQELQNRGYASREAAHRPRAALPTLGSILRSASDELKWILADPEQGVHLEQVRQFIETGAARTAASSASDAELARIHKALLRCHDAISDTAGFGRADICFHRSIVAVTQNPIILDLHDRFVLDMVATRPTAQDAELANRTSFDEHRQIFETIADCDPEAATTAMEGHLARAFRRRLAVPGKQEP